MKKRRGNAVLWKPVVGLMMGVCGGGLLVVSSPKTDLTPSAQFLTAVIQMDVEKDDFLTSLCVDRWGFLEIVAEVEAPVALLSPNPPVFVPEENTVVLPDTQESVGELSGGNWESITMTGKDSHVREGDIFVANSGRVNLESQDLTAFSPLTLEVAEGGEPQILIYHSHGTESFSQTPGYEYQESDPFRTLNMERNITAVGQAMAEVFEEAGFVVIHDKTLHDYPNYNDSYGNSQKMLAEYLAEYPSLSLIFDVHRDALESLDGVPYQLVSGDLAQVMLVVGTNGGGYQHDHWQENFSLALSLQQSLLAHGDFARPITLRSSRLNQHLSTGALLVEVGGHGNTFPQAYQAGVVFAEAVVRAMG